ncbi:hypothetical protein XENORESO_020051, partial [Xenotaenia resolanae]
LGSLRKNTVSTSSVRIWTLSLLSLKTTDSEPVLEPEPSPSWQSQTPGRSPQSEPCPPSDIDPTPRLDASLPGSV